MWKVCSFVAAVLLAAPVAIAHGGGLNAEGCHTNRKTGDYHCHRSGEPRTNSPSTSNLRPARPSASPLRTIGAYRNCTAARAAGAAPVRRGEPGYGSHLDRDNDGIGCE